MPPKTLHVWQETERFNAVDIYCNSSNRYSNPGRKLLGQCMKHAWIDKIKVTYLPPRSDKRPNSHDTVLCLHFERAITTRVQPAETCNECYIGFSQSAPYLDFPLGPYWSERLKSRLVDWHFNIVDKKQRLGDILDILMGKENRGENLLTLSFLNPPGHYEDSRDAM